MMRRLRAREARIVELAALGAAVLILLQLSINYWLYSYIVWFFPLVILAVFACHPPARPLGVDQGGAVSEGLAPEPLPV